MYSKDSRMSNYRECQFFFNWISFSEGKSSDDNISKIFESSGLSCFSVHGH